MESRMDQSIFVERSFDLDGSPLVVRFQHPEKATGGEFRCRWSIGWPDGEFRGDTPGEDGIQALMLAMQCAHHDLLESAAYKAGKLTLWGQADLDLPPDWATGPLYQMPPPPGRTPPDMA